MKHYIRATNKGYVIYVYDKSQKVKYFLKDESHTIEPFIFDILNTHSFKVGEPFGDSIYPIYVTERPMQMSNRSDLPTHDFKTKAIWRYYRSLAMQHDKPKWIKFYADQMRSQLRLLGVDNLYKLVQKEQDLAFLN